VLGLFGAALASYWPALHCGFVWNDSDYVTAPALQSLRGLWQIWFKLGATQQYYPLLHSAFWTEHRLWGDAPLGYHLVNVLLHAGSASLLWVILRRLAIPGAWLAAMIFAVHPVCAESVAWVSEEKNTLSTLFYLVAFWSYLRFDERRRGADYALGLTGFALALLSKTVAATLPGALLVVLWWKRGRLGARRDVAPLLPWFAVGAASGLFSAWMERTYIGANGSDFTLSLAARTLVAGRAIWFYLGKLLWPAGMNFIYPRWHVSAADAGQYFYPVAAVAVTVGLGCLRRRTRAPLAAWLFFVGSLFPTLGFLNVYAFIFSYVADHWQYLASIGIFTLVGAVAATAVERSSGTARRALQGLIAAALGLLGALTWKECGTFHDVKTFYRTIVAGNPDAFMAQNNLGIELQHEGNLDAAIAHFESALRIRAGYVEAHTNLGLALVDAGRLEESIGHYQAAIRIEPQNAVVHNDLGVALAKLGRLPEAIQEYEEAARLNPSYLDPALNLGFAYFRTRQIPAAIANYERALQLKPDDPVAHNCLGLVLASIGRRDEAVNHYRKAIEAKPDYADAHCNLGAAYGSAGRFDDAEKEFAAALRTDNGLPDAHYNLGLILSIKHEWPAAIEQFAAAVRLRPNFADAEVNWGRALQSLGRAAEAQVHLDKGARLQAGRAPGGMP
jgi:tetratricopeptide (TPR) repeat protein